MREIYVIRDRIVNIVHEYDRWFLIAAKFVGMMFVFSYVNGSLGYFEAIDNVMVNILLSLICSIAPGSVAVFLAGLVVVLHMVSLSAILGLTVIVVMVIAYLLFLRFSPEQSIVILAVPVLMQFNLHYVIPVLAGLFLTPYAVIPAALGMFMVKFVELACGAAEIAGTGLSFDLEGITEALESIVGGITEDRELWMYIAVCAVTMFLMYIITRFSFDYCWYVAIGAGAAAELVTALICRMVLNAGPELLGIIVPIILGGLLAVLLQFMKCTVDYRRKEYLQFEDDDYYYYVKAVPKIGGTDRTNRKPRKESSVKSQGRTKNETQSKTQSNTQRRTQSTASGEKDR